MNRKKKLLFGGLVIGASYYGVVNKIINSYFKRNKIGIDEISYIRDESLREKAKANKEESKSWFMDANKQELYINAYDGTKLHGYLINNLETDRYIIIAHGVATNLSSLIPQAYNFEKFGYNSLIIDQRAFGESEGTYSTMGFKESQDLIKWIYKLNEIKPNAKICLLGSSMGAATVCMALGHKLPDYVKCAISDCGFTTLKEQIKAILTNSYHFPVEPMLTTVNMIISRKINISYNDVRPIECIRNNTLPICFVHGQEDHLVPFSMCNELYEANKGPKKLYAIGNKDHCQCRYDDSYYSELDNFIKEYM